MSNILWVDDDVNRYALLPDRDELESRGNTIIEAPEPDVFLKIIKEGKHRIDCVIIDISMPTGKLDMEEAEYGTRTGLVLIRILKELDTNYKNVPVVVYTVIGDEDVNTYCCANGIKYLKKDISSKKFADEVMQIINSIE